MINFHILVSKKLKHSALKFTKLLIVLILSGRAFQNRIEEQSRTFPLQCLWVSRFMLASQYRESALVTGVDSLIAWDSRLIPIP
jgi:hypothetical protein